MSDRKIKLIYFLEVIADFFKLIRIQNLLILAFTQYFARVFLIGSSLNYYQVILESEIFFISICTAMVAAAGYIINDYYDIKIDMLNKPNRVVLNKHISRRMGIFLHVAINGSAAVLAYFTLSFNVSLFIILCSFLLWLYSNYLKRTAFWGNLCIAFLAFGTLFMIGLFYKKNMDFILLFGFFAFATTLIREVIKDVEDIRGDMFHGCKTLPIVIGIKRTKIVLYIMIVLMTMCLSFTFLFLNKWLFLYLLVFTIVPMSFLIYKLSIAQQKKDFHTASTLVKIIMIVGIAGMVLV